MPIARIRAPRRKLLGAEVQVLTKNNCEVTQVIFLSRFFQPNNVYILQSVPAARLKP